MSTRKWTTQQPLEEDKRIASLARFGAEISKHLSDGSPRVSKTYLESHTFKGLGVTWELGSATLERLGFMVWERVADLDQVGLRKADQRTWTVQRWEKEIRKQVNARIPHCAFCGTDFLATVGHKCKSIRVEFKAA